MNYLSVVVQTSAAVVAFNFNGPSSGVRSRILYDSVLVANLVAFVCLTAALTLSTNLQSANAILGRVGSVATFLGFPRRPSLDHRTDFHRFIAHISLIMNVPSFWLSIGTCSRFDVRTQLHVVACEQLHATVDDGRRSPILYWEYSLFISMMYPIVSIKFFCSSWSEFLKFQILSCL